MKDDVLGLQIAVDDLAFMHIVQGFAYLLDDYLCGLFVEFLLLFQESVKLARGAEFLEEIDVLVISEKGV